MAIPNWQANGTLVSNTTGITVAWPTHQTDDIALLLVQSANEAVTLTTANGFVQIPDSPQGVGTAAAAGSCRLTAFWCRATSNAMASPVVADPGDHAVGVIVTFRLCVATGDPWDVTAGDATTSAATAVTIPGDTTTVADCLVVAICAQAVDLATSAAFGTWANASLANGAERFDQGVATGVGGGFGVYTGEKAAAGLFVATTAVIGASTQQGRIVIALKPLAAGGGGTWGGALSDRWNRIVQ